MGAQQIHSYSYSQILLSLSLTQTDLQFQLLSCQTNFCSQCWAVPKGQTISAGWSQMMQINICIFSFFCWQSKANHYNLQLFLLHNLAATIRSGAGLEVGPPVLLPRLPSHLHQTGFVVGDLGIKCTIYNIQRGKTLHLLEQMTMTTASGSRSVTKMAFKMLMARMCMMMIMLVV